MIGKLSLVLQLRVGSVGHFMTPSRHDEPGTKGDFTSTKRPFRPKVIAQARDGTRTLNKLHVRRLGPRPLTSLVVVVVLWRALLRNSWPIVYFQTRVACPGGAN